MEILRDGNANGVRMIACMPSLLVWTLAALSASRWLDSIGRNQLEFADSYAAHVMPVLWWLVMVGLPIAVYLAYRAARARLNLATRHHRFRALRAVCDPRGLNGAHCGPSAAHSPRADGRYPAPSSRILQARGANSR